MQKWIEVNLKVLAANAKAIRSRLDSGCRLMAVIKADAYGHGATAVAQTLMRGNLSDALGVWSLEEAESVLAELPIDCRTRVPFALLAPCSGDALKIEWGVRHGVWFSVEGKEALNPIAIAAAKVKKKAKIFIDVDSGLGRWGILPEDLTDVALRAASHPFIEVLGASTHLDYVSGLLKTEGEMKLNRFLAAVREAEGALKRSLIATCANTSVFLDFSNWNLGMARIGNLLYGVNPTKTPFPVKNVWAFKARVAGVRAVRKGEAVGYAGEFLALKPMKIASVPCGFSDGLTMEPAHRFIRLSGPSPYYAKKGNARLPFLGRPGFGHVLLDAAQAPGIKPGDIVELPVRRSAAPARIPRIYK